MLALLGILSQLEALCFLDPFFLQFLSSPCSRQASVVGTGLAGPTLLRISVECVPLSHPPQTLASLFTLIIPFLSLSDFLYTTSPVEVTNVKESWDKFSFIAELDIPIWPPKLEDEPSERLFLAIKLEFRTRFPKEAFLYMIVFISFLLAEQHKSILHSFVNSLSHLFSKLLKGTVWQIF